MTAKRQGVNWVEFDVSVLGDGTPVIHHDATLDRCTNANGPLIAIGADDLPFLEAGPGEPLPTLEQTLDLLEEAGMFANLEMKPHDQPNGDLAAIVAETLQRRPWTAERVIVSSFDAAELHAIRSLLPDAPLAVVHHLPPPDWPYAAVEVMAAALHVNHRYLDHEILENATGLDMDVRVFTINEPELMVPFRDHGLTGLITDHPPLFLDEPDWRPWLER